MNTSKRILFGLMSVVAVTLLATGCISTSTVSTNPDGTLSTNVVVTLDINKTTNAISKAVPPLVKVAAIKYPVSKKYLADVSAAILVFSQGSDLSPDALNTALDNTGVGFLQTDETQAVIDSVTGLYSAFYRDSVNAKIDAKVPWLIPILRTLAASIDKGLTQAG